MIHHLRPLANLSLCVIALIGVIAVPQAHASVLLAGPRGGVSFEPHQLILGGQIQAGFLGPVIRFVPSVELGFGDDVSTVALNGDFLLKLFNLPNSNVRLYALAGPTIAHFSYNKGGGDTEIGASVGGGLRVPLKGPSSYYIESRFGFGDIPDLKLIVGMLFGL